MLFRIFLFFSQDHKKYFLAKQKNSKQHRTNPMDMNDCKNDWAYISLQSFAHLIDKIEDTKDHGILEEA